MSKEEKNSKLKGVVKAHILQEVSKIPKGEVRSYGEIARASRYPRHARYVGSLMAANCDEHIPCHRVVRGDGTVGGYNRGVRKKVQLLREEGVHISCRQGRCYVVV